MSFIEFEESEITQSFINIKMSKKIFSFANFVFHRNSHLIIN